MADDTSEFDDLVLTNPKLPSGWRPYHSDGTRICCHWKRIISN
jgi:hypothetical protein